MDPGRACAACTPSLLVATLSLSAWRDFSPPPLHLIALGRLIIFVLVFFYISGFRFRFLYTPSASLSITHEDGTALVGFGHPSHDRDSASKKKKLQASFRLPPRLLDPSRRSTLDTNSHDPPHRRQDTHRDRRLHRTSLTRLSISSIFSRCSARCPPTELFAPHITICYLSRARAHTHTRARVLASSYPFSYFRVIICSRTLARFVGRALLQCLRCLDERAAERR